MGKKTIFFEKKRKEKKRKEKKRKEKKSSFLNAHYIFPFLTEKLYGQSRNNEYKNLVTLLID